MDIASIRTLFKKKRAALSTREQEDAANAALAHWQAQMRLTSATRIGLFWSVNGELPTQGLISHCLKQGQQIFLPKTDKAHPGKLLFGEYHADSIMKTDRFGIPSPCYPDDSAVNPETFDVIVMPLVAADLLGNRIGMGAGYYDRTLACLHCSQELSDKRKGPVLVGWCYEWQVLTTPLRPERWDIPLHGLITDKQVKWFHPEKSRGEQGAINK